MNGVTHTTLPHQLPIGTRLRGRYRIEGVLGEGGFGITYLSFDETLRLNVAVKEYYPRTLVSRYSEGSLSVTVQEGDEKASFELGKQRFLEEARTLGQFRDDPNILSVFDYFEENGTAYIVMEYLEGEDLLSLIESRGRIPFDETFGIMLPVFGALEKLHAAGLIHRDISPSNIRILPDGRMKLLDFGAVRSIEYISDRSRSILSKPGYSPVEQYLRKEQGPWIDVYALCATMYHMITGTIPEDSLQRVLMDELRKPSEQGADISPRAEAVLCKGLSVDYHERYQTIRELKDAFAEALDMPQEGPAGKEPVREEPAADNPAPAGKKRTPIIIACCAVAVAALVILIAGITRKSPEPVIDTTTKVPEVTAAAITAADKETTAMAETTPAVTSAEPTESESAEPVVIQIPERILMSVWGAYYWKSDAKDVMMTQTIDGVECELRAFPDYISVTPDEPELVYIRFSDRFDYPYDMYAEYSLHGSILRLVPPSRESGQEGFHALTRARELIIDLSEFSQGHLIFVINDETGTSHKVDYFNAHDLASADRTIQGCASDPDHCYNNIYSLNIVLDANDYQAKDKNNPLYELLTYLRSYMTDHPDIAREECQVVDTGGGYTTDAYVSYVNYNRYELKWSQRIIPYNGRMQETNEDGFLEIRIINCYPFGFCLYDSTNGEFYFYNEPVGDVKK
nr:serine/threonine protein kinase [Lachnospiraceae bacterium]